MKSAQSHIREMFRQAIKSNDERFKELMNHVSIKAFQKENPEIPLEAYRKSFLELDQFVKEQENCAKCTGLETCKNMLPGYCSVLKGGPNYVRLQMKKCHRLEAYEQMKKRQELMQSHQIPKSVLAATFETIDFDERTDVIAEVMAYCDLFEKGIPKHGLYLYGPFGVGKSHIAAAAANYLTGLGIDVFMVYVPDFVQTVYDSIRRGTTSELVEAVKRTKVLILDDIGAESLNPWMRDEILGAILQHRMAEELPTLYTSNLTLDELEQHLAFTAKGGHEKIKALRIMERIRNFTKPICVTGRNRRENSVR